MKATEVYIENKYDAGILTSFIVHYGKTSTVTKKVYDPFGIYDIPLSDEKGQNIFFFKQLGESEIVQIGDLEPNVVRNRLKNHAKKNGFTIVNAKKLLNKEDTFYKEIPMGMFDTASPPLGLYTEGLVTCIGVSLYNPNTKRAFLYHTPGCDEEKMSAIGFGENVCIAVSFMSDTCD